VKVTYARRAEADLDAVASYTEEMWGPRQCDIYLAILRECCERVLALREAWQEVIVPHHDGRPRRAGLYRYHCQHHYVYFRQVGSRRLHVIRVLHEKMLPGLHL
jgi:plasmid stabilization system protein ParE